MSESRTQRLQQLLKRLGQAIHGSVVDSDEVQACLRELHSGGWDAVMLLEASLACRKDGKLEVENAALHIHADSTPSRVAYRINRGDAHFLQTLGISPSRHRSPGSTHALRDDEPDR